MPEKLDPKKQFEGGHTMRIGIALLVLSAFLASCYALLDPSLAPHNKTSDSDLVFLCGQVGMGVDFVTKNCISADGSQVNPYNLYPPFQSPLGEPDPAESIMRCQGQAVDFVTGRCM